jgi:nucleoid-associated protein YgaU
LRALNPVLVKGVTPPGGLYPLRVPAGTGPAIHAALTGAKPSVDRHTPPAHVHVVRPRDTVSAIAKRYGVSVADVLRWNTLAADHRLHPGDRLVVSDVRPSARR